jgi:hypothetical protein
MEIADNLCEENSMLAQLKAKVDMCSLVYDV